MFTTVLYRCMSRSKVVVHGISFGDCKVESTWLGWKFQHTLCFLQVELLPEDEEEEDQEEDEDEEDIQNLQELNIALRCFDDACIKLNIMLDVIEKHQMLQSITVTDIMNQGKIFVPGDRIAELRDLEKAKLSMPGDRIAELRDLEKAKLSMPIVE